VKSRWPWIIAAFLIANLIAAIALACIAGGTGDRVVPGAIEVR
jgi:hypothetical protein